MFGNYYMPMNGYQGYGMGNAAPDQLAYLRAGQQNQAQMQPMQQMQAPQMQSNAQPSGNGNSGLIWVQGEAGAKSYIVAPGNTVMLMDSEANVFYIKSADASGMPLPLRTFDYSERTVNTQMGQNQGAGSPSGFDPSNFITREEFDARIAQIMPTVQNAEG